MFRLVMKGLAASLISALAVAAGTIWHRAQVTLGPIEPIPLGLMLGLGATLAVMVFSRAAFGGPGLVGAGVGAFVVTQLAAQRDTGGGLLIQADVLGYTWVFGALLLVVLVAFCPRRWFSRT